jgi:hypothetical protein
MDDFLQQGIAAAKAGDKARAFQLLARAAQDNSTAEQAWLWLSSVVNTDGERLFCLGNVLRINPNNPHAKPAAVMLRQKGVFPSAPTPPAPPQPPAPVMPQSSLQPAPFIENPVVSVPQPDAAVGWLDALAAGQEAKPAVAASDEGRIENGMTAHSQYVALELENNKPPLYIVKELTNRGLQPEVASRIVSETQGLLKKARGEKYRKRMARGALWTIAGLILTCGSYAFASESGGSYVLCWGAIIFGLIDFIAGLIGWVFSQ